MAGPDAPVLPAYGRRSLSEVVPALLAALGVPGMADVFGVEPAQRVCLLLVDGLGARQLAAHAADAPFLAGLTDLGPLTAGFPSSTSTSITSLATGVAPGAHGMVGISFRIGPDQLLDTLRWSTLGDGSRVDLRESRPPERIQPREPVLRAAAESGVDIRQAVPAEFRRSGLTRATLRAGDFRGVHALGDLAAEVITALGAPGRVFCYAYHADLDSLGHRYGPGSLPWRLQLATIDELAVMIAERLPPGGLLAVTADHGMIEVPESEKFDADTDPALRAGVRLLGGDPRSRLVYAQPGAAEDVLAAWRERLGARAWVLRAEQAVADGWFGPVISDLARPRIGDVVVALRGNTAVVRSKAEPGIAELPGQHGSLTTDEQEIPLLLARG